MIRSLYRPWGQLSWIIERCDVTEWDLFASLSTEERCLAVHKCLSDIKKLRHSYMARIADKDSRYTNDIQKELSNRLKTFHILGGVDSEIHDHFLFERKNELITELYKFIDISNGNIVLDISSLPKRFFFPIIKLLLKKPAIRNLIACYSVPTKYSSTGIAEDYESWRPLPLFEGNFDDKKPDVYFIGAGHMTMGLPEELEALSDQIKIIVLVPFPGHAQSTNKVLEFVRDIERNIAREKIIRKIVYARDVPEIYNYLVAETNNGKKRALFAPYGPKPMSLAMCIFACQAKISAPVFYTQPSVYPPDYSSGILTVKNEPQIYSYCLRLNGSDLYTL